MTNFNELLNRYTRANGGSINRRKSAQGFQDLMNKGSLGAALTFGLLSAESDEADREQLNFTRETKLAELSTRSKQQASTQGLQTAQAQQIGIESNITEKTGMQVAQQKIENMKAENEAIGIDSKVKQQNANTQRFKAENDSEYKKAALDIDGQYKKGLLSIEDKNLLLKEKKIESEIYMQVKDLDFKKQKLAIDEYIQKGQLSIQQANSVSSRITAVANAGLTVQQTQNAQKEGLSIEEKNKGAIDAQKVDSRVRQQQANTESFKAQNDVQYKQSVVQIDSQYKQGLISIDQKNTQLKNKKIEAEMYMQIKDLDFKSQKLAIDAHIQSGQLSIQQANAITSRIGINASAGLTVQQTQNAEKEGLSIKEKNEESIKSQKAQTKKVEELNKFITQQQKLAEDTGRQSIAQSQATTGQIDATAESIDIESENAGEKQKRQKLADEANLQKLKNQNKNAAYELLEKEHGNLQTIQAIDIAIAKNMKRASNDGFFSSIGTTIFGELPEEEKIKNARLITLKYLQEKRKIYAGK